MQKNKFLRSTLILLIGSFITKTLGFFIKIMYTRIIGPEGISLYTLIVPLFSLTVTIAGFGMPFAISKISSSDANTGELLNVFFDELELDGLILPRIPGAFSTVTAGVQASDKMDGVFGNNFLQRFNMTLDLQRGFIYLEPNNLLYKPFYDFLLR